jgi:hypothetical protein
MARFLHTMVRITHPEKSRVFYEALGFAFAGDLRALDAYAFASRTSART